MAALIKLRLLSVPMQINVRNHFNIVARNISTSKKNSDTASTVSDTSYQNWVSYGFDYKSKEDDTNAHHASFFFSVTLCLVFGGFMWAYAPDVHMRDWAQREAFLELRRREKAGLPPIDPNLIDPKLINLPSDNELGDTEIII